MTTLEQAIEQVKSGKAWAYTFVHDGNQETTVRCVGTITPTGPNIVERDETGAVRYTVETITLSPDDLRELAEERAYWDAKAERKARQRAEEALNA